jgi:hypothetical protein
MGVNRDFRLTAVALIEARVEDRREDYLAILRGASPEDYEGILLGVVTLAAASLAVGEDDPLWVLEMLRQHALNPEDDTYY